MENTLESAQIHIMQLMVTIAQNDHQNAKLQLDEIREMILEGLDHAAADEELVKWSKFLKIVDELETKLTV